MNILLRLCVSAKNAAHAFSAVRVKLPESWKLSSIEKYDSTEYKIEQDEDQFAVEVKLEEDSLEAALWKLDKTFVDDVELVQQDEAGDLREALKKIASSFAVRKRVQVMSRAQLQQALSYVRSTPDCPRCDEVMSRAQLQQALSYVRSTPDCHRCDEELTVPDVTS